MTLRPRRPTVPGSSLSGGGGAVSFGCMTPNREAMMPAILAGEAILERHEPRRCSLRLGLFRLADAASSQRG